MLSRYIRPLAAGLILLATVGGTIYFFRTHPAVGQRLTQTSPLVLLTLLGLYLLFVVSVGLVFRATLVLCRASLPGRETLLVTAYSSIINFFGPLQSGPAFRALYLKKRHGISLKNYTLASLFNYFFYALFSGLFLLSGLLGWLTWPLLVLGAFAVPALLQLPLDPLRRFAKLDLAGLRFMALAVLLQVSLLGLIFYFELHSINPATSLQQALVYTGAANFALFVSITPGAIGFRESFVIFASQLHHLGNATIVAASLLDRGVYIVMLLLLVAVIFGTHSSRRLINLK